MTWNAEEQVAVDMDALHDVVEEHHILAEGDRILDAVEVGKIQMEAADSSRGRWSSLKIGMLGT